MDQMTIEAMRDVEHIRNNAARERANGLRTTDAEAMTEHLVAALARVHELEGEAQDVASVQNELDTANEEIEEHEEKIEALKNGLDESKAEAARLDGELDEANRRIADMEANIVEWSAAAGKVPRVLSSLRSDLAIAGARLDCGMDSGERAAYKFCLRADLPGGDCAACAAAKMQRENDGLKNSIEAICEERDRFLIEAQTKATRVTKVKAIKVANDGTPSLFALMPQTAEAPPKAKRKSRKVAR
jgi:chromosome segregation ATPase